MSIPTLLALACVVLGAGGCAGSERKRPAAAAAQRAGGCEASFGEFGVGRWPPACWRPFGSNSPFNRRVASRPRVQGNSAAIVARLLRDRSMNPRLLASVPGTRSDFGHPIYWSRADDPVFRIRCTTPYDTCRRNRVEGRSVRIPDLARPAGGSDSPLSVIDQAANLETDFYSVTRKDRGGGVIEARVAYQGPVVGPRATGLGFCVTAACFSDHAGIVRAAELEAGRIDHALTVSVPCTRGTVRPARGRAYQCPDRRSAIALGQRLWLDMDERQIAARRFPRWKQAILRAWHRYGAFVADTHGNSFVVLTEESDLSYTSFGRRPRLIDFFESQGAEAAGDYRYLPLSAGVPWARRLRALAPCRTSRC